MIGEDLMTYLEAVAVARTESAIDGVSQHVCATLTDATETTPPTLDETGYRVSDWFDGSTVLTFERGEVK